MIDKIPGRNNKDKRHKSNSLSSNSSTKQDRLRAHYIQHVIFEGLGNIEMWLHENEYEVTNTKCYEDFTLPCTEDVDFLIILGGPMSVNDENIYPWLAQEKLFVRELIERGKAVLGICLRAQIIASAMGARVYPCSSKEIGWYPISGTYSSSSKIYRFPYSAMAFHWHCETFDLPAGAVRLAKSRICKNQAFQLGSNVIGIQFHLETTWKCVLDMLSNCGGDINPLMGVQSDVVVQT
ncbi:type 1 glutamine amidotransferase [Microbulbifer epialgicus]|uniref:Type 1 glutamine amidotransferase n=1 Tax=Microbulbifer epialgicus TaxID=393907 RepID=A0ABV4P855_9GAMM